MSGGRERMKECRPFVPCRSRSAWVCSQISGPLCHTGAWRGLGHRARNKIYTHQMSESKAQKETNPNFQSSLTYTLSSNHIYHIFCFCSSSLNMHMQLFGFHHQSIWIRRTWLHRLCLIHKHTVTHTLRHILYVVVSVNSAVRPGLWTALFDNALLDSAAALFIVQPVSCLKVDSNLCSSFG